MSISRRRCRRRHRKGRRRNPHTKTRRSTLADTAALWTSNRTHRARRDCLLWGTSAGENPVLIRVATPPEPIDKVDGKPARRPPVATQPASAKPVSGSCRQLVPAILLYKSPRTPRRRWRRRRRRGSGERGTKVPSRAAAATSTTPPGHTHRPARSSIDKGRHYLTNLRSGGILLKPATAAAGAEKQGGHTLAPKTVPSLLLYKPGRRIRPLLQHRRARGPRDGEAAGTGAGELVASLVASLSYCEER